ncbi:MAG: 1-acyl-sn-glycerol-3-phosphate acyltransferase, partial [Planctomycetes bacterium]|nr:1-acyl-sn-glycerol-3-phosphate acyltransferase [Planctomycetota bacterium]
MLEFSDKPYRHFPARRNALVAWLMEIYNRHYALPRQMRIASVQLSGFEDLAALRRPSDRLLLLPNHPTHCDPNIYTEALRRIGVTTHVMAAYDVFLRSRRVAWIMQRMGTFSVDREGSDPRAMKQAADTLLAGRHALTIFPEGNVYLQNDVVTPFHDGAALIGLRAARTLADKQVRILAVPIAIKVTHIDDVRGPLNQTLQALADALQTELPPGASPLEAARLIGRTALLRNLQQRGVEPPAADSLTALIEQS